MVPGPQVIELDTPHGTARAHVQRAREARAAIVLGHGAGGGVEAPDLAAVAGLAGELGITTVLVEQPYRVAGRRAPAPMRQCEAAWIAVIEQLQQEAIADLPLVVGGRSMGARVACRTAGLVGAVAVLCLAFPLQPPARRDKEPAPDRLAELDGVAVPTLVVQGARDPFGMPPPRRGAKARTVVAVAGDHSLKADMEAVRSAVDAWLASLLG